LPVSQRFLFAIFLLIAFTLVGVDYLLPIDPAVKFLLVLAALAFDILAFSTKLYMDFFIPFLKMKGRTVVINTDEPFRMAPSNNAIVVRKGADIFASAFVTIPTYRSATEMNQDEKIDFARLFSRALTLTKLPVKFGAQLYVINKDEYINNIKRKLDEAEERYQTLSISKTASKSESERIRGEVTMWHNLFESVNKVKSQALEAYAMTTAQGGTEEEAINLALQQADEIAAGISAIFGVQANIVEGADILRFIEPDYMIPFVTVSEQMRGAEVGQQQAV
jgi:hypothetical protein